MTFRLPDVELEGRRLLTRHHYGDGRWGMPARTPYEERRWGDWRVVKIRPKRLTWAQSTGRRYAYKTHAVRYMLTATHLPSGNIVRLTVWWCGQYTNSMPEQKPEPSTQIRSRAICAACRFRLAPVEEPAGC